MINKRITYITLILFCLFLSTAFAGQEKAEELSLKSSGAFPQKLKSFSSKAQELFFTSSRAFFHELKSFSFIAEEPSQEVKLDQAALEKFRKDPDYDYYQPDYVKKNRMQLNIPPFAEQLIKIGGVCVISLLLLWLIWRYRREIFSRSRSERKRAEEYEESINRDDLEQQLNAAIQAGNFNEAIRFRYLLLLRFLDRNQYIVWNIHKTTREYLREMKDPALQKAFSATSSVFNYYRYGNGIAGEETYERFNNLSTNIINRSWERK